MKTAEYRERTVIHCIRRMRVVTKDVIMIFVICDCVKIMHGCADFIKHSCLHSTLLREKVYSEDSRRKRKEWRHVPND